MPKKKTSPIDTHAQSYGKSLRANVYALWGGSHDVWEFLDAMYASITLNFTRAWSDGASTCGMSVADYSPADQDELRHMINSEIQYALNFAKDILTNPKGTGKLTPLVQRTAEWANKYYAVYNTAVVRGCSGQKLMWQLGRSREHCVDCVNMDGRVYLAETWRRYNVVPGVRDLSCRGYNCACALIPTSDPLTPGYPPMLLGRKSREESPIKECEVSPNYYYDKIQPDHPHLHAVRPAGL